MALGQVEAPACVESDRIGKHELVASNRTLDEGLRVAAGGIESHHRSATEVDVVQTAVGPEGKREGEAVAASDP